MTGQPSSDPPPDPIEGDDPLDAGLAAAFGPDNDIIPPLRGSVLQALGASLPAVPRVLLRDPLGQPGTPVVRTHSETLRVGPTHLDPGTRYQLLGELARGGMGAILKGRDTDLGRDLAVKVLLERHRNNPELLRRFIEEAQIGGQLQHPGIAPIYELGQFADGRPYFTMKLVKGRTLAVLLTERSDAQQDRPRFLGIFEQVCQTLAYAHARGVIHRDLKPANVMVGTFGEVQVMDWGLAKVLAEGGVADERRANGGRHPPEEAPGTVRTLRTEATDSDSQVGSVMGTPAYMAPEQARGEVDQLDERCDVFGLGAMLCEILTGQPPYVGTGGLAAYRKAARAELDEAFARLDGCGADAELVALAKRCLAAKPADRPRHAGVLAAELAAYLQSVDARLRQAELAGAAAEARAVEERKRRQVSLALAASVLLTVLLGGGGWLWITQDRAARERQALIQQAQTTQRIHDALDLAQTLRDQARGEEQLGKWAEARALAERARTLADSSAVEPALAERIATMLRELDEEEMNRTLIARCEEIRLLQAETDVQRSRFAEERALPEYARAFATAGLRVGETPPDQAAALVRQRPAPVVERLVQALDDWLMLAQQFTAPEAEWLAQVLAAADQDSWRLGLRHARQQKNHERLEQLANEPDVTRQPPQTLVMLAGALGKTGSPARAAALLRRAQERYPSDFWINHNLARFLTRCRPTPWDDVIRFYAAALALRPTSAGVLLNFGLALQEKNRLDEALAVLRKAIELKPDYAAAYVGMGYVLSAQGRRDEARAAYHRALELAPSSAYSYVNLSYLLKDEGRLDDALAACRKAVELQPDLAQAHATLGWVLADKGRRDDALAACRKAIALDPDLPDGHRSLGMALTTMRRFDEAIVAYRKALELRPDSHIHHYDLSQALHAKGRHEEALAAARQAAALRPDFANAYFMIGRIQSLRNQFADAVAAYRQTLALRPDYAEAYCNLGHNLRRLGRYAEALAALRRGHELGSMKPGWPYPSARWVQQAAQFAELEAKVPKVLRGKAKPAGESEWLRLIEICRVQKRHAAAAQLYADAFAALPTWADDVPAGYRFRAASQAALAAAGRGADTAIEAAQRNRWRKQALAWLRADLTHWAKSLEGSSADDRAELQQELRHWLLDPNLAGIRDGAELAALPGADQEACQQLWAEVIALLRRAQAPR